MNRKLLQSVREYKKESIMTPILVIFEVFMEVLIPLLMARIIDVGIANGDMGYILSIGVVLVIMAMVSLFFGAMAGRTGAIASSGYAKNLRHDIFYKIQEFSFKNMSLVSCFHEYADTPKEIPNTIKATRMITKISFLLNFLRFSFFSFFICSFDFLPLFLLFDTFLFFSASSLLSLSLFIFKTDFGISSSCSLLLFLN